MPTETHKHPELLLISSFIKDGRAGYVLPSCFMFIMRFFITIYIFFIVISSFSQNLVPNPSFESYSVCPDDIGQIERAIPWTQPLPVSTTDYFNFCSDSGTASYINRLILSNTKTGNGVTLIIIGIKFGNDVAHWREYLQVELNSNMIPNKFYCISFYVRLFHNDMWCTKNIGALFSINRPTADYSNMLIISNPQVIYNDSICDPDKWYKIEGQIVANDSFRFITIGNFESSINFYHASGNAPAVSYFIDDVAFYPCDAPVFVAKAGENKELEMCKGDSVRLGSHELDEYLYAWFVAGNDTDTLSTLARPRFSPATTTTYVLKVKDFKFDETSDTVSVKVISCGKNNNLHIFPNPGNGLFSLQTDFPVKGKTEVMVFNTIGQKLKHTVYQSDEYNDTFALNLENFAAGVYHVRFKTAEETLSGKVILLH